MGITQTLVQKAERFKASRRGFIKGAVAGAALVGAYGCSKNDDQEIIYSGGSSSSSGVDSVYSDDVYYTKTPTYRYGTTPHDCGGRCITKAQVSADGRIVRLLTDDIKYAYDGTPIDMESPNCTQARACSRCRSYKYRLYHPGRLKYPLKQTKKRGDLSGFVRISWAQAFKEIVERLRAVQNKYGVTAVHSSGGAGNCASPFQGTGWGLFNANSSSMALLGGCTGFVSSYSWHQLDYMGTGETASEISYTGIRDMNANGSTIPNAQSLGAYNTDLVLWGANVSVTRNPRAYAWTRGVEEMKARDAQNKVWFIGPELSEFGVAQADEWVQSKPYTDVALICGMLYYMIDKTLKSIKAGSYDADRKAGLCLDFDYIDMMVYGFFDSPAYWVNKTTGSIVFDDPSDPAWTYVQEVKPGTSFSAYIMGDDPALTTTPYGTSNYVAAQFGTKNANRNMAVANYQLRGSSAFKDNVNKAKTPAWASAITGVSEATITALGDLYLAGGAETNPKRIWNEVAGGMLKQAEGCATVFALQSFLILTKNWGKLGTGMNIYGVDVNKRTDPNEIGANEFTPSFWGTMKMPIHPDPTAIGWHASIKRTFGAELAKNGYKSHVPDWNDEKVVSGEAYYDDGGVKALVMRKYLIPTTVSNAASGRGDDIAGATFTQNLDVIMPDGTTKSVPHTYFKYDGGDGTVAGGNATYAGCRFVFNAGGNVAMNQHANTIETARMYELLPTYGYGDHKVDDPADAFCMVSFDNFMTAAPRYSDYVLPAKTAWEQADFISTANAGNIYVDSVVAGPGESKSTWEFSRDLINAYAGIDAAKKFTGADTNSNLSAASNFKDVFTEYYNRVGKSKFMGKKWEEFLAQPISHAKPVDETPADFTDPAWDRALSALADPTTAFCPNIETFVTQDTGYENHRVSSEHFAETDSCPQSSGRFQVYSGSLVWRYENLYNAWHGYLPQEKQGQKNEDADGNPIVYPIPMYFNYEDYFRVAYGLSSNSDLGGRFLLTTTHEKARAHTTHGESPFVRELTTRVEKGSLYSGNDFGTYAVAVSGKDGVSSDIKDEKGNVIGYGYGEVKYNSANSLIGDNGLPVAGAEKKASYADIWVNKDDFKDYADGELVKVYNEIGTVICAIRKTNRCVKGYVGLHEGFWFDPRGDVQTSDVIDVGGCCNTLMANTPSRMDHGNAQQSACVKIEKFSGK